MKATAVAYLLGTLKNPPSSATEMQELLRCSRATAFRWLKFIREFDPAESTAGQRIAGAFQEWASHAQPR